MNWLNDDSKVEVSTTPLFELCGKAENINDKYFLFPLLYDYMFYKVNTIFYYFQKKNMDQIKYKKESIPLFDPGDDSAQYWYMHASFL